MEPRAKEHSDYSVAHCTGFHPTQNHSPQRYLEALSYQRMVASKTRLDPPQVAPVLVFVGLPVLLQPTALLFLGSEPTQPLSLLSSALQVFAGLVSFDEQMASYILESWSGQNSNRRSFAGGRILNLVTFKT